MELLGHVTSKDDRRIIAETATPAAPIVPAVAPDRGWTDAGMTIVVCFWVLRHGWALFSQQQGDDAKMTQTMLTALLEQNKILILALTKREP